MKFYYLVVLFVALILVIDSTNAKVAKCIVRKKHTKGHTKSISEPKSTKNINSTKSPKNIPVTKSTSSLSTSSLNENKQTTVKVTKTIPTTVTKTIPTIFRTKTAKSTIVKTTSKKATSKKTSASITSSVKAEPTVNNSKSSSSLPDIVGGSTGKTTRYWDCCVPTCAWKENTNGSVVNVCKIDGKTLVPNFDYRTGSACSGGSGYMCNDNQPWALNDKVAFGFVASSFTNGSQADWCCSCYRLQFTSGNAKGKQMIVQVTNTGSDLSTNHFDIQIPGGGVGIFNGCQSQWGTGNDGWGQRYGGISDRSSCKDLPKGLQDGCYWRYDWFKNSDNPAVTFEPVQCPTELTSKSGCVPKNNSSFKKIPWN